MLTIRTLIIKSMITTYRVVKWERVDSLTFFFSIGRSSHKYAQRTLTLVYFILNAFWFEAEVQSLRRRRDDILDVGESTLDVGELTVGETTRRRNDRLPPISSNMINNT